MRFPPMCYMPTYRHFDETDWSCKYVPLAYGVCWNVTLIDLISRHVLYGETTHSRHTLCPPTNSYQFSLTWKCQLRRASRTTSVASLRFVGAVVFSLLSFKDKYACTNNACPANVTSCKLQDCCWKSWSLTWCMLWSNEHAVKSIVGPTS